MNSAAIIEGLEAVLENLLLGELEVLLKKPITLESNLKELGFVAMDVIQLTDQLEAKHSIIFPDDALINIRDSITAADAVTVLANAITIEKLKAYTVA